MAPKFSFVLLSFLALFLVILGVFDFVTNYEENRCHMTYMFEYPQLVKVSLPNEVAKRYRKYGLFAYGEGWQIEKVREMRFNGIPVLFIPGNRGSPKQVRSLASISRHKALNARRPFHLDFFTVDFNDEYSGLFGGFLNAQTEFVNLAIERIISLYRSTSPPHAMVLIGHSMGGMIAKGLFLEKEFKSDRVKVIITLATPHTPVLITDQFMAEYYWKVNSFWDANDDLRRNISLVSIGGGRRDLLVRSSLTNTPHAGINVLTSAIQDVWMTVDHLCILWCKQFMLVLVRSIFDMIDLKSKQISKNLTLINDVFDYHLVRRSGSKHYHATVHPPEVSLWDGKNDTLKQWTPINDNTFSWNTKSVTQATYLTISLGTPADTAVILTTNHETADWLFACVFDFNLDRSKKACKTGKNLSRRAQISPSSGVKRKKAIVDLSELRMSRYTHVVIRTLPTDEYVNIDVDIFKMKQRTLQASWNVLSSSVILPETESRALYYNIDMGSMKTWKVYKIYVDSMNSCSNRSYVEARVNIPWSNEGFTTLLNSSRNIVPVSLSSPRPPNSDSVVNVELFGDPSCNYKIGMKYSIMMTLGYIISNYGVIMLSFTASCLLLTLSYQVKCLEEDKICPLLHLAMPGVAKPYTIIPTCALTCGVIQFSSSIVSQLPSTDLINGEEIFDLIIIPVTLYMASFAIVYLVGIGIIVSVIFHGQAYNGVILRFLNKFLFGLAWLSEYILSGVEKLPLVVTMFLIATSFSATGGLTICLGLGFYFFKLVSMYEEFWEEMIYWPVRALKAKLKKRRDPNIAIPPFEIPPIDDFNFHLTLMMLWCVMAIVSLPSVLTWAKDYRFSTKLDRDPFFLHSIILSVCAGVLWQSDIPRKGLKGSAFVRWTIFSGAVLVMTFGQISWYRITAILTGIFAILSGHQLMAPRPIEEVSAEKSGEQLLEETAPNLLGMQMKLSSLEVQENSSPDPPELEAAGRDTKNQLNDSEGFDNTPSSEASTSSFEQLTEKD